MPQKQKFFAPKFILFIAVALANNKLYAIELDIQNEFQSKRLIEYQRLGAIRVQSELKYLSESSVQDGTKAETNAQKYIPKLGLSLIQKTPHQTSAGIDFESEYHIQTELEKSAPYAEKNSKFAKFNFGLESFAENLAPVGFHFRIESHLSPKQKSTFNPGEGAIQSTQNRKFALAFKGGLGLARRTPRWTLAFSYFYGQQIDRDFETIAADNSKISGTEKLVLPSTIEATLYLPNVKETQLFFSSKVLLLDSIKQENATESTPFQNSFYAQVHGVFPSFFPASTQDYFPLSAPQLSLAYRTPLYRSESTMEAHTLDVWSVVLGAGTTDAAWKWNLRFDYGQDTQKVPEMAHKFTSSAVSLMILKTLPMSLIGE